MHPSPEYTAAKRAVHVAQQALFDFDDMLPEGEWEWDGVAITEYLEIQAALDKAEAELLRTHLEAYA